MKQIHRFGVAIKNGKGEVELPVSARILEVQYNCMWDFVIVALVDMGRPTEKRSFWMLEEDKMADHVAGSDCQYVGSFRIPAGREVLEKVFYVFEQGSYL